MTPKNGFVRTVFYSLILAGFGWTTFVGVGAYTSFAARCKEVDSKFEVRDMKAEQTWEKQRKVNEQILISLTRIEERLGIPTTHGK